MKYLTVICCALVAFAAAAPQAPAPAAASEKKSPPTLPGGCPQFNAVASFDATKVRTITMALGNCYLITINQFCLIIYCIW